jgi:L-lysine 6-transaminase
MPFPSVGSGDRESEKLAKTEMALRMVESALEQMSDEIVGIIVEPIQGAGGQRVALPQFFRGLSKLAQQHDVYLAFDEVQTGFGATGKMFAIDHFDLPNPPIAVASGKKFGCGVIFMREPLEEVGVLDSTWGGTLADMVRVVQEMVIVEREDLIAKAATKGERLHRGLLALSEKHPAWVQHIRGMGLYQGFSAGSAERKSALIEAAREHHNLLLLGAGTMSIRTRPNLSVTEVEIDHFLALLDKCVSELSA